MPVPIIIRETRKMEDRFSATVQFESEGAPYPIEVRNPFSEAQEQDLEWYFEEWLRFPFTDKVKAENARSSIRAYGEAIFTQVFRANPDAYHEYREVRSQEIILEIMGSPDFHALHWEALHDPNEARPLAVDTVVVRKNLNPVSRRAKVQPAPQLRVLLVTSRPAGKLDVSYRTISRPLVEALETGKVAARIDMVRPGTFKALVNHLEDSREENGDGYYHIIHLDMHGALLTYSQYEQCAREHHPDQYTFSGEFAQTNIDEYPGVKAFLFFDDPGGKADGKADPVSADDLANLLNMRQIPIAVLNACQSGKQVGDEETSLGSRLLAAGVQLVVAMGYSVTVSAARVLMTTLYRQLLEGRDPAVAIRRARLELYHDKKRKAAYGQDIALEDWVLPVIYQNRAPHFDPKAFRDPISVAVPGYSPPKTMYRFVGRDLDILEVERRLLHHHNFLLIRGMGGAGKTTLLHHLGWWWQKTRFVDQVFFFGYDEKAHHLEEIIQSIGQGLGMNLTGIAAQDRATVVHALKSTRHLVILDNLESITGEFLAVPNTLPLEAREELRVFLQELAGTKTLVLLGSRGNEAWLRPDPVRDKDVYDLPGLDYEAQTALAEAILHAVQAPHYPEMTEHRDDFRRLLKLLGGYPLAMEVVLANLARATPRDIIERLQAADVNLDNPSESAHKTESILKCIDYSHSNLSEEAQALLFCLSPFTGVINAGWLPEYTALLKKQPALAHLPFDRWNTVFQEAVNWGLLQPHDELIGYLSLQPIFPYFLKARLSDEPRAEMKEAIETAFREHYLGIGEALYQGSKAKEGEKRQVWFLLLELEYENLYAALTLSLKTASSFKQVFQPLERFLRSRKSSEQTEHLCEWILEKRSAFSEKQLAGNIGDGFLVVNDRLALTYFENKKFDLAVEAYRRNLEIIFQLDFLSSEQRKKYQASTLHQLGMVAQEQRKWDEAEKHYKEAIKTYIEIDARYEQANSLGQLGNMAQEQLKWDEAAGYLKEALNIYIEIDARYEQAKTLHNLGAVAQAQRKWQEAEKYYKGAINIYIEFNARYEQAKTLHMLGAVAQAQRKWQEAEEDYKGAIKIYIEFSARYEQAKTLHMLGIVAQKQQQWKEAEGYYNEAIKIFVEFDERYGQAKTLHQLGMLAQEQQKWEQATRFGLEAAGILKEYQDEHRLKIVLRGLARTWRATRNTHISEKIGELLGESVEEVEKSLDELELTDPE